MDLAALSTSRLFCNIAENKLLATWPGLAPPISFKSWFICSAAVSRVGIERHDHRGGGNHGKVPPGGLAQFKAKMWPSNEMMDSVHGFLCHVICLDQLMLMDGFWSLRNIWLAAESCQIITSYHSFVSWWKEYQSSVHSPQLQRQCCWFKVKRMVPAPVFLSMWKNDDYFSFLRPPNYKPCPDIRKAQLHPLLQFKTCAFWLLGQSDAHPIKFYRTF